MAIVIKILCLWTDVKWVSFIIHETRERFYEIYKY